MEAAGFLVMLAILLVSSSSFSYAYDNNPLQDFCVAVPDTSAAVFVNGKICKNPKQVTTDDFVATGFNNPASTNNSLGFGVKVADVNLIPGLNTLGLTVLRVDFEPDGVVPPHTHPRATEVIVVLEGTIYAGFVTSNPTDNTKNKLFAKILKPGDVFVFPIGLVHFQRNVGETKGMGIVAFNSQNPGVITIGNAVFGTDPHIAPEVLTKSFQLDKKVIEYLQSKF
ncbi:germin-like protein subfamily 1 member 7 [Coffea eugenioides]|uniref:germin-like protein subfamily 1 member 7 n=1 Tax=Coffea eugenioides TaxID=49369 RepID=UPI000F60C4AC|nr:germin-like protein subfamily 1 member 7 [Coffea eugenioides]